MTEPKRTSPYRRGADDGFLFGGYLTVLFFTSVYSADIPILGLVCMLLVLAVPFIIYYFLRRAYIADYGTSLLSALWMQGIMIFLCGSLLCGAVAIIYLKWINPDFIINQMKLAIETYKHTDWENGKRIAEILELMIKNHFVPSAITIVIESIWMAVFSGSLLSLVMGLLARARAIPERKHFD